MAMPLLLLLTSASLAQAKPALTRQLLAEKLQSDKLCSNVHRVNNVYYTLDERKAIAGTPADLAVHWKSGKLFFTLVSDQLKMSLVVLHPDGEMETVKLSGLGQSTAVDNLNDIVYLATDNGVYKYAEDGTAAPYAATGEDVMYIALTRDGADLYIATWPQNRVHKITNEGQKKEAYPNIPNGHGLKIDSRDNIYFMATNTLYVLKPDSQLPVKIKGLPGDKLTGVAVSKSDEILAMDEDSNMFAVDADSGNAKYLGAFNVTGVKTFGMDYVDNVYLGVEGAIIKFNANEKTSCPKPQK